VSTFTHLCPSCFADKGNASACPHCGYDESLKRSPLVLPHRTLLNNGQYLIGKVLGKLGGFGITYLAFDTKLETKVAIKEYLPRDLAGRDGDHATISAHSADDAEHFRYGLTQFLQEARTLARFDHTNIVRVRNFFEENGTGYLVMDYYDGITLADYLAQQPQGKLPEQTAIDILMPILDGLREVHAQNFLHRDIKPQNIYLTTGNRAILLDFGAARQAMSERSRSLSVVLSEGYAPYEQYHRRGEQGPWTDIYSCAAVLYHAVAGEPPPPATERVAKDDLDIGSLGVSARLADALRAGLAVDHKLRPQTMKDFQLTLLHGLLTHNAPKTLLNPDEISPLNDKTKAACAKKLPGRVKKHSFTPVDYSSFHNTNELNNVINNKKQSGQHSQLWYYFLVAFFIFILSYFISQDNELNNKTAINYTSEKILEEKQLEKSDSQNSQSSYSHLLDSKLSDLQLPGSRKIFFDLFGVDTDYKILKIFRNGETNEAEILFVRKFKHKSQDFYGAFVAVYALDYKNNRISCHACAPDIFAVTYRFEDNKWKVISKNEIGKLGRYGVTIDSNDVELFELLKGNDTFAFHTGDMGQGYTVSTIVLLDFDRNDQWKWLGTIDVGEENSGACDDSPVYDNSEISSKCWDYKGEIAFGTAYNNKYPDILVIMTGTQRGEFARETVKAKNTKYIYNGKIYKKV